MVLECPRCGKKEIKEELNPARKFDMKKHSFHPQVGDERREVCGYCGWWSRAVYTKAGNSGRWQYTFAPRMTQKERHRLKERLNKDKHRRK